MMNTSPNERAESLASGIELWLKDESGSLQQAIEKTVGQGLFNSYDVMRALDHIRQTVTVESMMEWLAKSDYENSDISNKHTILCLHAGNLPLVGLQDIVAVLLSGHDYAGKISRKDPYLPVSLLESLKQQKAFGGIKYSTDLDDFRNLNADAVMFSGSDKSVPKVSQILNDGKMLAEDAAQLIRTAHSSVAWIGKKQASENVYKNLADAIFAYDGKGCRSVTTIFTDMKPEELLEKLISAVSASPYIQECILPKSLSSQLRYKQAFEKAVGHASAQIGDRLIVCCNPDLHTDGLVTIKKSSFEECYDFVLKERARIQSLYVPDSTLGEGKIQAESLELAQKPPLSWKPDGIDPLQWLHEAGT